MTVDTLPLFASNVFVTELLGDFNFDIKKHKYPIRDATQECDYFVLDSYPKIKKLLLQEFKNIAKNSLYLKEEFDITTSWLTKTYPGDEYEQYHIHKNSYYSGILYYGEYSPNCGALEFKNPLDNYPDFYLVPTEWNMSNSNIWGIRPKKNRLVIFPSYLKHKITKNLSDKSRYSLAFNIIPTGSYGDRDSFHREKKHSIF